MSIDPFRARVRAWFAENSPQGWQDRAAEMDRVAWLEFERTWLRTLNSEGFGAPHVPKEWGGGGYTLPEQAVVYDEWARSGAPALSAFIISLFHVPGTLLRAGNAEQQKRHVRDAINGVLWCQGFSEPEAGSDLASLKTRAVRDGDDYVITGQKIWSSNAMAADWCLLLARTDPTAAKHRGISYMIMDMHAPGVEVRPIKNNIGQSEFCELFLDEVRVPVSNLIGEENDGWRIAQRTLSVERGSLALESIARIGAGLHSLDELVVERSGRATPGSVLFDSEAEFARLAASSKALESLGLDMIDELERGGEQSYLASVIKVASSERLQRITSLGSLLAGESSLIDPQHRHPRGDFTGNWLRDFVFSWHITIAAGTNEIQRNIIAERLLGMPKEQEAR